MAEEKDVIGKADALLRRHQAGSETGAVPVLTEVWEPRAPKPQEPAEPEEQSDDFETQLVERVSQAVEARIARDLERRVTHVVAPQMDNAIAEAVRDIRAELRETVAQAVAEALRGRAVK